MTKSLTLLFVIILCNHSYSQNFQELLSEYNKTHHLEKIYVSTDKSTYIPDETIWGKIFLVDGRGHQILDFKPIVIVDWIDPDGNLG